VNWQTDKNFFKYFK